jgi:hypothetical protein
MEEAEGTVESGLGRTVAGQWTDRKVCSQWNKYCKDSEILQKSGLSWLTEIFNVVQSSDRYPARETPQKGVLFLIKFRSKNKKLLEKKGKRRWEPGETRSVSLNRTPPSPQKRPSSSK